MNKNYVQPEFQIEGFTCPHCHAFSAIKWTCAFSPRESYNLWAGLCHHCKDYSLWLAHYIDEEEQQLDGKMIYPDVQLGSPPNEDIPVVCRTDYEEARQIANKSPRAAAALLRLCIENLCLNLDCKGSNLNDYISYLVEKGLRKEIKQALDVVRVGGNNAIHPGNISADDNREVVTRLFSLVNIIIESQISHLNLIDGAYGRLSEGTRKQIDERDRRATKQS